MKYRIGLLLTICAISGTGNAQWVPLGPEGGGVVCAVQSVLSDQTLFVFSAGYPTYVYRSDDSAENWSRVGIVEEAVTCVDMSCTGTLYAGCANRFAYSKDEAVTWTEVNLSGTTFYDIEAHPTDTVTIYATGTTYSGGNVMCFMKSPNGGASWNFTNMLPVGSSGLSISVSTVNPSTIFVAGQNEFGYGKVFRTLNGGTSWTDVTPTGTIYPGTVSTSTADPDLVIFSDGNVYRSTDCGTTWPIASGTGPIRSMTFSPADSTRIIGCVDYGTVGYSLDEGFGWTSSSTGLPYAYISDILPHSSISEHAFVSCSHGFFKSIDTYQSWSASNTGLNLHTINDLVVPLQSPAWIYAQDDESGFWKSEDYGETWIHLGLPFGYYFKSLAVKIDDPDYILAIDGSSGAVCRSIDAGSNWEILEDYYYTGTKLETDASDPMVFWSCGSPYSGDSYIGIAKSTDGGVTWSHQQFGEGIAWTIELDPTHPDTVYLGGRITSDVAFIYRSEDGGINWELIGSPGESVRSIAVNPDNPVNILAATSTGIYMTDSYGTSWFQASYDIDSAFEVIFNPLNPSYAYVSTYDQGIWQSTDGGQSWDEMNTGLGDYFAWQLAFSLDQYLYTGTRGSSIYRYDCQTGVHGDRYYPDYITLNLRCSPNPCSSLLEISFDVPGQTSVELAVYDLQGRMIAVIEQQYGPGSGEELIDLTSLAQGVYFCRMTTDSITETRAITVIH